MAWNRTYARDLEGAIYWVSPKTESVCRIDLLANNTLRAAS